MYVRACLLLPVRSQLAAFWVVRSECLGDSCTTYVCTWVHVMPRVCLACLLGGGDIFPPICAFVCCSVCLKACVYVCVTAPVSVSVSVFFLAYEIARACVCVCMDVYTHCVHLGVCVWPLPTPTQCITKFCPLWPCRNLWNLVLLPSPLTTHLDDCNKSLCVSDFASFNLFFT